MVVVPFWEYIETWRTFQVPVPFSLSPSREKTSNIDSNDQSKAISHTHKHACK